MKAETPPPMCNTCSTRWYRFTDTAEHRDLYHNPRRLNDVNFQKLYDVVMELKQRLDRQEGDS